MRIVSVKPAKQHTVNIIFDSGESLFIDRDVYSQTTLHSGRLISEQEKNELKEKTDFEQAKSRALWYLDRSDHSEKGLYHKLLRAGFPEKACSAAVARLKELGLIDDRRYAAHLAERFAQQNVSGRAAYAKMMQKGIPKEFARQAIDQLNTDETSQIKALIEKKYINRLSDPEQVEKVCASLARKGFSFSAIREVLKHYSDKLMYENGEDF